MNSRQEKQLAIAEVVINAARLLTEHVKRVAQFKKALATKV